MKFRKRAEPAPDEAVRLADETVSETEAVAAARGTVAKVSHTLNVALAERLRQFAFFQRVSESAVIEFSLQQFFDAGDDDEALGERLRRNGAGRRRRTP